MDELLVFLIKTIVRWIADAQAKSRAPNPDAQRALAQFSSRISSWEQQRKLTKASGGRRGQRPVAMPPLPASSPASGDLSRVHRLLKDTPDIPRRYESNSCSHPVAAQLKNRQEVTAAIILGEMLEPPVALKQFDVPAIPKTKGDAKRSALASPRG